MSKINKMLEEIAYDDQDFDSYDDENNVELTSTYEAHVIGIVKKRIQEIMVLKRLRDGLSPEGKIEQGYTEKNNRAVEELKVLNEFLKDYSKFSDQGSGGEIK